MMSIENITNFIQISDLIASSGQPDDKQFKDIAAQNYRTVINLAMPNSENAIPEEGNIVTSLKMMYVHIPVPFDAPSVEHLNVFFKTMSVFSGTRVWVHCVVNYRVSAFLYLYRRLVQGETDEEAKKAILPAWEPNDVWRRFMETTNDEIAL
jgi:protein tyrosine phosphatase (PTP) superfamily phosphohydrolase (DUF442 family)